MSFPAKLTLLVCFVLLFVVSLVTAQPSRTFYLVNFCSDTIWFSLTSGASSYQTGKTTCTSSNDCVSGSYCNTNNGICFYNNPTPNSGNFRISPNEVSTLVFPFYNNNVAVWSGNLGACINGTCDNTPANCDANGCGTNGGAATRAEFTLPQQGSDYYDVTVINGLNVGIEIYPLTNVSNPADPYTCGNPGGVYPKTATGAASWSFTPPSAYYIWVSRGGNTCTTNTDCSSSGEVCGLSDNIGQNPRFKLTCGQLLGYFTADQICGADMSFGTPFDCSSSLPSPNSGDTQWVLYGCTNGISSCYHANAPMSCCGCVNWNTVGVTVPSTTAQCVNSNPNWVSLVQPQLVWLKKACPTCYTYPYDDLSSTFVCQDPATGNNLLNYEIAFCPELAPTNQLRYYPFFPNNPIPPTSPITTTNTPTTTAAPIVVTHSLASFVSPAWWFTMIASVLFLFCC